VREEKAENSFLTELFIVQCVYYWRDMKRTRSLLSVAL